MHIALFGGSFNPPHLGHLAVGRDLLTSKKVDEVWVIPSFKHPFGKELASFEDRMAMCHLLFDSLGAKVKMSEVEKKINNTNGWTITTLQYLIDQFPEHQFSWVMGSDLLQATSKWKDFDKIKKLASIISIPRLGYEKSKLPNISSTQVREAVASGKDISSLVSPEVMKYIDEKGLYR
jgi:nicotinate-nucleotide adenylyltransferase